MKEIDYSYARILKGLGVVFISIPYTPFLDFSQQRDAFTVGLTALGTTRSVSRVL